jgi:signal transduction histidine kinase
VTSSTDLAALPRSAASTRSRPSRTATRTGSLSAEYLLADQAFVHLVRWVFTARLLCLALAAPAALTAPKETWTPTICLLLLTASSLVLSRSSRLIRILLQHPLVASLDVAASVALLITLQAGQPAALTVICSALAVGLLFPRHVLLLLIVPLAAGSLGTPAAIVGTAPVSWQGWLALLAGVPALVLGICTVGAVVRHGVEAMISARHEVAEAVTAVGAAEERARLARDMHDSVGKSLHGISLAAKALTRVAGRDEQTVRELSASIAAAADQAAAEARALLVTLREGQDDRPTVDVLSEVLSDWQLQVGIPARLTAVRAVDAAPQVTTQMAAALGEILHNVAKHADAGSVTVVLDGDVDRIEMVVTDDGRGFAPDSGRHRRGSTGKNQAVRGHYGLLGLRERAQQVGGEVEIRSKPGEGTSVRWTAVRHPEQ